MGWTKRDRLAATIAGDKADRPPVALWRHWPGADESPDTLAAEHLRWQSEYDWDFVKVSPPSSFCLRDWGVEDCWDGGQIGSRRYLRRVIHTARQWAELVPTDPCKGMLAIQIDALRRICAGLAGQTPCVATVFSPLAQAVNLAGYDRVTRHLQHEPELLHKGLATISTSTIRFIEAAKETGISGIFLAVRVDEGALLNADVYHQFGTAYDLSVLEAADSLWLNMVHLHGSGELFAEVSKYKVQIMNWHDRECGIDLARGLSVFPRAVCGGISSHTLGYSSPATIRAEGLQALAQSERRRHILGVGCMTLMSTSDGHIRTLRSLVEEASCAMPTPMI